MISLWGLKLISTGLVSASLVGSLICVGIQRTTNRQSSWENLVISWNDENISSGYQFPYLTQKNKWRFMHSRNKYEKIKENPREWYMLRDDCFSLLKSYKFNLNSGERCLFSLDKETGEIFDEYLNRLKRTKGNSLKIYSEIVKEYTTPINYISEDFESISKSFNDAIEMQEVEDEPLF